MNRDKFIRVMEDLQSKSADVSLLEAAEGCRAAGFTPQQCAPELYNHYPTTTADIMAQTMVMVWAGQVSSTILNEALTDCKTSSGQQAYATTEITAAVTNNLNLEWLDDYSLEYDLKLKVIGLLHGDLTNLKAAEAVDFLVISALPGDYAPTPGSMIGALNTKGVSIANMATDKAADYEPEIPCWISQPVTSPQSGIAFKQVLVFEPSNPAQNAASLLASIFTAITRFVGDNTLKTTVAMPMLSTGSGGADPSAILTAAFNDAKSTMNTDFNLYGLKIVVFEASRVAPMKTLFDQLKTQ